MEVSKPKGIQVMKETKTPTKGAHPAAVETLCFCVLKWRGNKTACYNTNKEYFVLEVMQNYFSTLIQLCVHAVFQEKNQSLNSTVTALSTQVGSLQVREEELSSMLKLKVHV